MAAPVYGETTTAAAEEPPTPVPAVAAPAPTAPVDRKPALTALTRAMTRIATLKAE